MQADNCRDELHSHDIIFVTPILRVRKYGSLGVKVWHFWVVTRMVWRGKCHSYALHFAESTACRLRFDSTVYYHSTPPPRRVDCLSSPSRLHCVLPLDSATSLSRLADAEVTTRKTTKKRARKQCFQALGYIKVL